MQETKKDKLISVLQKLRKVGSIVGSSVISPDGLQIASDIGENIDKDTFAAMSAAMHGAAETAVSELAKGELRQIIVDAEKGKIITISAGEKAILILLAEPGINLGLVLLELGKAARRIADIIGE
ncbi:roadblock/LC7 domain-containing protein [Candidatus Woesearchaeota archaeon]|nr:roadblock/LC7 domain-containing protein [Candidatus Woesearchaeota archaeon]